VPPKVKKPAGAVVRNPDRTRQRILDAALKEFSARGFAGARVGGIARSARINKRMLYHYFTDKEGLFRAVLHTKLAERMERFQSYAPAGLAEGLPLLFQQNCDDADWVRLTAWESLQTGKGSLYSWPDRRRRAVVTNKLIRSQQKDGHLRPDSKPEHLHLALASLAVFPMALPQLVRVITGLTPDNPKFQREYARFLETLSAAFRPSMVARK